MGAKQGDLAFIREHAVMQPNTYWCGPCSLRHALLWFGHVVSPRRIARLACTTSEGTDLPQMQHAATALDYRLTSYARISAEETYEDLRKLTQDGPVLTCIDYMSHWVAIVGGNTRAVTICDSSRPGPVIQRLSWAKLFSRMCVWTPGQTKFDIYPVTEV